MNEFEKVPARAVHVWRLKAAFSHIFLWAAYGTGTFYANYYGIPLLPIFIAGGLLLVWSILQVGIFPYLRRSFSGYRITDEDVWLYDGGWTQSVAVVPLFRIQHVQIRQDPFLKRASLADVELETAATGHRIRGLSVEKAEELRSLLLLRLKEGQHV